MSWSFCFVQKGTLTQQIRYVGSLLRRVPLTIPLPYVFSWVSLSLSHILEKTLCSASLAIDFYMGESQIFLYIEIFGADI